MHRFRIQGVEVELKLFESHLELLHEWLNHFYETGSFEQASYETSIIACQSEFSDLNLTRKQAIIRISRGYESLWSMTTLPALQATIRQCLARLSIIV